MTRIFEAYDQDLVWEVRSDFEPVAGTKSLLIAKIHEQSERDDLEKVVFLDTKCSPGLFMETPQIGDKVEVNMVGIRSIVKGYITEKHSSIILFVKQKCY